LIERCLEDALQKGVVEYLQALDRGKIIENRDGFIVHAAYCRAIDELRRGTRQSDTPIEAILNRNDIAEAPADDLAMDRLQAEELHKAMGYLRPEEQRILKLCYFDGLTVAASAKALFWSESSFRRKLKQTLQKLGELLDQGSQAAS
jgi:RNA polymerase sigma factor (sigma-70 family)